MTMPILVALAGMTLAPLNAEAPASATFDGKIYTQLIGEGLREAVEGKRVRYPQLSGDIVVSNEPCDIFGWAGHYVTCGDRVPRIYGTYLFFHDRVCATVGGAERCWKFYRDGKGEYLIGRTPDPVLLQPIELETKSAP